MAISLKKSLRLVTKDLYRTEWGRWAVSLLVSFAMIAGIYLFVQPMFMTIDDARLKYVYAGFSTGEPVATYLFSKYPLGLVLSSLYRLLPDTQWYPLYQFGLIGLGCTLIGKTIYRIGYRKDIPFVIAMAIHVLMYILLAVISTILVHFEITAAVIATAGVTVLTAIDFQNDSTALRVIDGITAALCLAISFVVMFNAFYAACCYVLVAAVAIIAGAIQNKSTRKVIPGFLCFVLVFVILIICVIVLEDYSKNTPEWQTYLTYNKYRVSFWDYPHMGYADDPELFEAMGWSAEFYTLTQSMYFMDSRFNQENLSQFINQFSWFHMESLPTLVRTAYHTLRQLFVDEIVAVIQTIMLFLFGIGTLCLCCSKKRWRLNYPQLLSLLCCLGGTVILILYLAARGRLPIRAWLAISMPAIAVMTVLMLQMYTAGSIKFEINVTGTFISGILCGIMICLLIGSFESEQAWRRTRTSHVLEMEQYAASHPENIYVYDHSGAQNYSVFSEYPDSNFRPSNAFVWGSSYLFTPTHKEQLQKNGIDRLMTEDFFDRNVYFITETGSKYYKMLAAMLKKDYGSFEVKLVDRIGSGFVVYKLSEIPKEKLVNRLIVCEK